MVRKLISILILSFFFLCGKSWAQNNDSIYNEVIRQSKLMAFRGQYIQAAKVLKKYGFNQLNYEDQRLMAWYYQLAERVTDATYYYAKINKREPLDTTVLKQLYFDYLYLGKTDMAYLLRKKSVPAYIPSLPRQKKFKVEEVLVDLVAGKGTQVSKADLTLQADYPVFNLTLFQNNKFIHAGMKFRIHPQWKASVDYSFTEVISNRQWSHIEMTLVDSNQVPFPPPPNPNSKLVWKRNYEGAQYDTICSEKIQQHVYNGGVYYSPGKDMHIKLFGMFGLYTLNATEMRVDSELFKPQLFDTIHIWKHYGVFNQRSSVTQIWQAGAEFTKKIRHHEFGISGAIGHLNGFKLLQSNIQYGWFPGKDFQQHLIFTGGMMRNLDSNTNQIYGSVNAGKAIGRRIYISASYMLGYLTNSTWNQSIYVLNTYDQLQFNRQLIVKYIINSQWQIALMGMQFGMLPNAGQFNDKSPLQATNLKYNINFTNLTLIFHPK